MPTAIRPFHRSDREQVTDLVNAHVSAVVPGAAVSVNTLMSQLEREPGEYVVDPWVRERCTLVAVQRGRVVGAAHLLRYTDDESASESYRGSAEIRWLVHAVRAPLLPDAEEAAHTLITACLARLAGWRPTTVHADGALPAPGVYGIPEQWTHVRALLVGAGFAPTQPSEQVLLARVEVLRSSVPAGGDWSVRRSVGVNGTRFAAVEAGVELGYVKVDTVLGAPGRTPSDGWADVGNLWVDESRRRRGVGRWLVGQAADWLALGGVRRVLSYVADGEDAELAFHQALGFTVLTRTERGWTLPRPTA
ncbi:MAG: GNAT family N-acetyltransferase [Nocardioides sp.]|nr:GNAT family N-acetyltransferase [Nocardioides sp.]